MLLNECSSHFRTCTIFTGFSFNSIPDFLNYASEQSNAYESLKPKLAIRNSNVFVSYEVGQAYQIWIYASVGSADPDEFIQIRIFG